MSKHGLRVSDHLADARKKEGGLDPGMLSYLLDRVRIDRIPDYVLEPVDIEDFRAFVSSLRGELADLAFPER